MARSKLADDNLLMLYLLKHNLVLSPGSRSWLLPCWLCFARILVLAVLLVTLSSHSLDLVLVLVFEILVLIMLALLVFHVILAVFLALLGPLASLLHPCSACQLRFACHSHFAFHSRLAFCESLWSLGPFTCGNIVPL